MGRLTATILCDLRLQWRNGLHYATGFVVLVQALLLTRLPALDLGWLLPVALLESMIITTFYFVAGLVLLERGEHTLPALLLSPLRPWEYLAAKVVTLTLPTLVQSLVLAALIARRGFDVAPLLAGCVIASALFVLIGCASVARYDSLNAYLLPSIPVVMLLLLPILPVLTGWESRLLDLHPLQASLALLQAAFTPQPAARVVYGLVYGIVSIGLAGALAVRELRRCALGQAGEV